MNLLSIFSGMTRRFLAIAIVLLAFGARADLWTTGYYPGYRQTAMPPAVIDFSALTHIIHFSAIPTTNGTLNTSPNGLSVSRSASLVAAAHAANVKALFSVGPSDGSVFTNAASVENLPVFINNLTNFMVSRGYDGIDIDWEPIKAADESQFVAFVTALRSALDEMTPRPLLTVAVYSQPSIIATVEQHFDQINIMTYGMSGAYPGWITWHNAPLFNGGIKFPSTGGFVPSTESVVNRFIDAGVPPEKLGIGVGFFGKMWSGGGGTANGGVAYPGQSYTTDPETSSLSFSAIMSSYYETNRYHWDTNAQSAYLSIDEPGSENDKFISYDDERSCQTKVSYARNRQLGGVMIWELGQGYRASEPAGKRDQLLQTLKQSMETPRITGVARTNQSIAFSFTSLPLASYRVEWTTNLASGDWFTLTNNLPGTGGVLQITDSNAVGQVDRFYRVKTPP